MHGACLPSGLFNPRGHRPNGQLELLVSLEIKLTSQAFDKISAKSAVVTLYTDMRPLFGIPALVDWRLNGRLSKILIKHRFEGDRGEVLLLPSEGRMKSDDIMVLGLGERAQFSESYLGGFIQFMLEKLDQKKVLEFAVSFSDFMPDRFEWRNAVRLLVSKLHDFSSIQTVYLCEPEEYIKDARRRHMDFGSHVQIDFDLVTNRVD